MEEVFTIYIQIIELKGTPDSAAAEPALSPDLRGRMMTSPEWMMEGEFG
jgi:hypothetical protein